MWKEQVCWVSAESGMPEEKQVGIWPESPCGPGSYGICSVRQGGLGLVGFGERSAVKTKEFESVSDAQFVACWPWSGMDDARKLLEHPSQWFRKHGQSLDEQHQHHSGACEKCTFLALPQTCGLRTCERVGNLFSKPSWWRCRLKSSWKVSGNCLTTGDRMPWLLFPATPWPSKRGWWAVAPHWPREASGLPPP